MPKSVVICATETRVIAYVLKAWYRDSTYPISGKNQPLCARFARFPSCGGEHEPTGGRITVPLGSNIGRGMTRRVGQD